MIEKIWTREEFIKLSDSERNSYFKFTNGDKKWYKEGEYHRLDGPAIEYANGDKHWFKEGKYHRLNGPAIEYVNGYKSWYIEGEHYKEEEFKIKSFAILNNLEKFL